MISEGVIITIFIWFKSFRCSLEWLRWANCKPFILLLPFFYCLLWQFNMLTLGPEIWTNTAYEISTLWVKLRSQMQNKLQTWYWSIMPQAEQSRNAIFESKPIDLKEWETTLAMILLLICDDTNKCVSWNEPCTVNTWEENRGPTKRARSKEEERWHSKESQCSEGQGGGGRSFQGPSYSPRPFHRMTKSLRDQNANVFKAIISWCSAQRGNLQILCHPLLSFKSKNWYLRK